MLVVLALARSWAVTDTVKNILVTVMPEMLSIRKTVLVRTESTMIQTVKQIPALVLVPVVMMKNQNLWAVPPSLCPELQGPQHQAASWLPREAVGGTAPLPKSKVSFSLFFYFINAVSVSLVWLISIPLLIDS